MLSENISLFHACSKNTTKNIQHRLPIRVKVGRSNTIAVARSLCWHTGPVSDNEIQQKRSRFPVWGFLIVHKLYTPATIKLLMCSWEQRWMWIRWMEEIRACLETRIKIIHKHRWRNWRPGKLRPALCHGPHCGSRVSWLVWRFLNFLFIIIKIEINK